MQDFYDRTMTSSDETSQYTQSLSSLCQIELPTLKEGAAEMDDWGSWW